MWIDDELVQDVAVRTKGNSSLMQAAQCSDLPAGLKVDFNFFNSARSYHGIKKLCYSNGFSDPTLMKEFLGYELMAAMGVPTPRACFVDFWVNDTHLGVYTQVEAVDATFVAENFDDGNGNLYKPEIARGRLDWTEEERPPDRDLDPQASTTTTSDSFNVGGRRPQGDHRAAGDDVGWIPGRLDSHGDGSTTVTTAGRGLPEAGQEPGSQAARPASRTGRRTIWNVGLKTNEEKADYSSLYDLLEVLQPIRRRSRRRPRAGARRG